MLGVVGVDDRQPVGDHRAAADRCSGTGFSCLTSVPKFDPVCSTRRQVVPEAAQVVDDVGAVAEQAGEELDVGHARDRAVDRSSGSRTADRPCPA